jgi:hypothetical protein
MSAPNIARRDLRVAVLAALQTIVGVTIESPPTTATAPKQLPYIGLRCGPERKVGWGKQQLGEFTTTSTMEILARASAPTEEGAQDAIEALVASVEDAVFTNVAVLKIVSAIPSAASTTEISGEGSLYQAECQISIDFEMTEVFEPAPPPAFEGVNVHVDAGRPFDASGTYTGTPFPASVRPAPRTAGPDGRDEGLLQIDLPQ